MNIILVESSEIRDGRCVLTDRRAEHLRTFLHAEPGRRFRLGIADGPQGWGTVTACDGARVAFDVDCSEPSPEPWFDLILAIPRPRSLKRIFFQTAATGVRNIWLVGAERVEKSYFSMHLLRPEEYRPVLFEGLMQARTTRVPTVTAVPKLRDLWALLPEDASLRLIANPAERAPDFTRHRGPGLPLIAVGPDGGWTDAENTRFAENGFEPMTLGIRPLRTDTAVIALAAVVQDRLDR